MAGLTKKGKTYYALFPVNGKTKWKRIGNMPYKDAVQALKKLEATFDKDKLGIRDIKSTTFDDFSTPYLQYSKANKAYPTYLRDRLSIRTLSPYFGNMLLEAIDNESIELYKVKRQTEGVKPRTINIELLCASNMLRMAVEWHLKKKCKGFFIHQPLG